MKKFSTLLLLFALFMVQGAKADNVNSTLGVEDQFVSVGSKATAVTASTDASTQWYIITQTRNGESAIYDNGTGNTIKRASTTYTADYFNGRALSECVDYLVRFISTGTTNVYTMQFATGNYICNSTSAAQSATLTTTSTASSAVYYYFYDINSAGAGNFGWNCAGTSGSITALSSAYQVDNNGAGNQIVYWGTGQVTATGGNNVWYIYPVTLEGTDATSDVADDLVSSASSMLSTSTSAFDVTGLESVQEIINAVGSGHATVEQYKKLEAEMNGTSDVTYTLKEGSYYVRSKAYRDNNTRTETIMSSLTNVMGLCAEATNYWSIWDITKNTDGTYNFVNQGNKYIFTPGQEMSTTDQTDDGYLYYDDDDAQDINVGSTTSDAKNLTVTASFDSSTSMIYATISYGTNYVGWYSVDNIIHFVANGASNYYLDWEFIPLAEAATTEGIEEGREEKFERVVNELEGYVGGVVTLNDVEKAEGLMDIVGMRDAAIEVITKIEAGDTSASLTYTMKSTADGFSGLGVTEETHPAAMYAAILKIVAAIKNSSDTTIKGYYQNLRPKDSDGEHPFFIESICGNRPAYGSRISEYDTDSWRAVDQASDDYDADLATFYVTEKSTSGTQTTYNMYDANNYYIGSGYASTSNGIRAARTTDSSAALEFVIDPVIPGVWRMTRATSLGGSNPRDYLTITSASDYYAIHYYYAVETSSLWKYHTYNHLPDVVLNIDPDATGDSEGASQEDINNASSTNYYATFSYPLNARLSVKNSTETSKNNPVPYYCTSAKIDSITDGTSNSPALLLTFVAASESDGNYLLKANTGYLFKTTGADALETVNGTRTLQEIQTLSGTFPTNYDTANLSANLLEANHYKTTITSSNWSDIFALTYNSADSLIGYYNHDVNSPVYGMGVGFYHIKVGGSLKAYSAYIPRENLTNEDITDYTNWGTTYAETLATNAAAAKMIFLDSDGNLEGETDAIVDLTDEGLSIRSIADDAIYDLSGRKVSKPAKGIYIVNGKKVLY